MSSALRWAWPLLVLATLGAAPVKEEPPRSPKSPGRTTPRGSPAATPLLPSSALSLGHAGTGACGACHSTGSWREVKFNHDRTGFPLEGRHARTSCKACHAENFRTPIPRQCSGCHEEPHAGDVGVHCEGCHDVDGWRSSFGIDGHRRSGFPLLGAHGALPCLECHPDSRELRFARPAVPCAACHEADCSRTQGSPVDHQRLGFLGACSDCHGAVRFSPATFPAHDACFAISLGPHSALGCLQCHSGLPAGVRPGRCATTTAACSSCHAHQCSGPGSSLPTDRLHAAVAGYQCADRKCFECHRGATP